MQFIYRTIITYKDPGIEIAGKISASRFAPESVRRNVCAR
jgi:hypothetical protein